MSEQVTVRRRLAGPSIPIRTAVFFSVFLSLIVFYRMGSTVGYALLAGLGVVLGLLAALGDDRRSRWGIGLGVALSTLSAGALWELQPSVFGDSTLLVPGVALGSMLLAHLCLWLGTAPHPATPATLTDRRRILGLRGLLAMIVGLLVLQTGYIRLPCSWLDPMRKVAGCQRALTLGAADGSEWIEALAQTSQGAVAVSERDGTIRLWRADDGALLGTIQSPDSTYLRSSIVSPDGSLVAVDDRSSEIRLVRVRDGTLLHTLSAVPPGVDDRLSALAFAPDGATFATSALQRDVVELWSVADGRLLRSLPQTFAETAHFSPDGSLLAVVGGSRLNLWRVADGTRLHTIQLDILSDDAFSFSPDGQLLAVGGRTFDRDTPHPTPDRRRVVRLVRVADGALLQTLSVETAATREFADVDTVAFAPDGATVVTQVTGDPVQLWRVGDGALLRTLSTTIDGGSLLFADDGTLLIADGDRIYSVAPR